MKNIKVAAIGVPWYREADYPLLRELFVDGQNLPVTYDQWLEKANSVLEHLKGEGRIVEKAYIAPKEFVAWCAANKIRLDSNARTKFASEFALRKYRNCS